MDIAYSNVGISVSTTNTTRYQFTQHGTLPSWNKNMYIKCYWSQNVLQWAGFFGARRTKYIYLECGTISKGSQGSCVCLVYMCILIDYIKLYQGALSLLTTFKILQLFSLFFSPKEYCFSIHLFPQWLSFHLALRSSQGD